MPDRCSSCGISKQQILAKHEELRLQLEAMTAARDLCYEPLPTSEMPLGHDAATERLTAARGSIYAAFDNLACGMDHDEAVRYLAGSPAFLSLPEDVRGKVAGMVLGFALTAVESDRKVRRMGRWFSLR